MSSPQPPNSLQSPHSIPNKFWMKRQVSPPQPVIIKGWYLKVWRRRPGPGIAWRRADIPVRCRKNGTHNGKRRTSPRCLSRKRRDIPVRKSFRRDILAGYLENMPFVFIDLARKRKIWDIYPIPNSKQSIACLLKGNSRDAALRAAGAGFASRLNPIAPSLLGPVERFVRRLDHLLHFPQLRTRLCNSHAHGNGELAG